VAYAALEESVRLLQGGTPSRVLRLSRRTRHVPVAVDRDGDVAVTMFLRRGVSGEPWIDVHSLERAGGKWRLLGGGGGNAGDTLFVPRPNRGQAGSPGITLDGGGTVRNGDRLVSWGVRWVRWAELRLAAEVAALEVRGRRIPVAEHGVAVVVWTSRNRPAVMALGRADDELGRVPLPDWSRH